MPPKPTKFQERHVLEFGLTVQHRDVDRQVDSVRCEFCQHFGRERKPDALKAVRKSVTFFTPPYRRGSYVLHLEGQHPAKWEEYQQLAPQQQLTFFVETAMVNNTDADADANTDTDTTNEPTQQSPEYTATQKMVQQYKETAAAQAHANKEGTKLKLENDLLQKKLRKCQQKLKVGALFAAHDRTQIENLEQEKGQLQELNKMLQETKSDDDDGSANDLGLDIEEL
jgi:uncharacterized protein (DUF4415 family)